MKLLVIVLALVLLLAGGGVAAWWFLLRDAGDAAEAAGFGSADVPDFVEIAPFTLPVMRAGRVEQLVKVIVVLEVPADGSNRIVYRSLRRLKDAYLSELYKLFSRRFVLESGNLEYFVRRRLMVVSETVLGPGVVQNILIHGIEAVSPGASLERGLIPASPRSHSLARWQTRPQRSEESPRFEPWRTEVRARRLRDHEAGPFMGPPVTRVVFASSGSPEA